MEENLIFGHTWEEIKKAQQKQGSLHKPITPQEKPLATEGDIDLLKKHGIAGLLKMGFHGVIDRLRTSSLV
jgi:hypothetical protein